MFVVMRSLSGMMRVLRNSLNSGEFHRMEGLLSVYLCVCVCAYVYVYHCCVSLIVQVF